MKLKILKAFYNKKNMCGQLITDRAAIISNANYPSYDQQQICNAQIKVRNGFIIKAYIIDLSIR